MTDYSNQSMATASSHDKEVSRMQAHRFTIQVTAMLFCLAINPVHAKKVEELDRIIAVVNNDVITKTELDKRKHMLRMQLKRTKTEIPPESAFQRQVLEGMIVEKAQLQLAKRRGIRVSDEDVNRVITRMARENKISLDQFRKVLNKDGVSFSDFRDNTKNNIMLERIRGQIVDKEVNITKQEVDNYLKRSESLGGRSIEYKLSHIMISIPEAASPEQIAKSKQKAETVLKKLRKGADFAKMAIANSDDQSALKGGKMGWLKAAQLPSLFEEAISSMKKGQISSVIRSPSGFHIIKLEDKRSKSEKHIVNQVLARHILIKPNTVKSDQDVRRRLQELRKRIIAGEDFGKLAKLYSDDKGSALEGGSLGWMSPSQFVPEFEKELDRLKPGELSKVFKSRFGWHLVQLMSRRRRDDSDEYRRTQIKKLIYKRKANEVLNNWIRRIRDEAYVEYYLND